MSDTQFSNKIYQSTNVLYGCFRQYPMPKVKDVARPSCRLIQNGGSAVMQLLLAGKQNHWIKVPLNSTIKMHTLPGLIERHSPIDPDHLRPSLLHCRQQSCRVRAKVDDGNAGRLEPLHK